MSSLKKEYKLAPPSKLKRAISEPDEEKKKAIDETYKKSPLVKMKRSVSLPDEEKNTIIEEKYLELLEEGRQTAKSIYIFIQNLRNTGNQKYYNFLIKQINQKENTAESNSLFRPYNECKNDDKYIKETVVNLEKSNLFLENECKKYEKKSLESLVTFTDDYYNSKTMLSARCTLRSLIYEASFGIKNNLPITKPVINDIIVLKQGTASGAFGRVYFAKSVVEINNKKYKSDTYVLKIVKKRADVVNLLHEIVVGNVLNRIRNLTPSFMYCFGGLYCPLVYNISNEGSRLEICNKELYNSNISTYTKSADAIGFFEDIKSPQELDTFTYLKNCTIDEFISILIHMASALSLGQKQYKFMHNDLHLGNVMFRYAPKSDKLVTKIVFIDNNVPVILDNVFNSVYPVMIDYGLSTCEARLDPSSKEKVYIRPPSVHQQQTGKCWIFKEPHMIPSFDFVFFFLNCLQYVDAENKKFKKVGANRNKYIEVVDKIISYYNSKVKLASSTIDQLAILILNKYHFRSAYPTFIQPLIFEQYKNLISDESDLVDVIKILLPYIDVRRA